MRNRTSNDTYYGNEEKKFKRRDQNNNIQKDGCFKQFLMIMTSVLGIISLLALIALNIANLAEIYRSKQDSNQLVELTTSITDNLNSIKSEINDDLKPKTSIINTATSFKLPALITNHAKLLQTDIIKYCAPRYDNKGNECPLTYNPLHSGLFSPLDPGTEPTCILQDGVYKVLPNITMITFSSFIPSPTSPSGCTRIPSFSLGDNIYSYTHSMIIGNCDDHTYSIQFWTIGKIISSSFSVPIFENMVSWSMADTKNRKSCSTVAASFGAWLACSIVNERERDDYNSTGIQPLNIAYMDVYGRRRQWFYEEQDIVFDREYDAFYFSVGSGVMIDNKIYFLAYGGLRRNTNSNAYCYAPSCSNPSQETCNTAQKPGTYHGKQTVNAIVEFVNSIERRPVLKVRTIPQMFTTLGAEGRLYYFPHSRKAYIYKRSTSWHAYLMFGEINLLTDLTISWYQFSSFTRPGSSPCQGENVCPKVCVTGVYTDYYPLVTQGYLGISVVLRDNTQRINPSIFIGTTNEILLKHKITTSQQEAAYTTTTCFRFDRQVWCLSIVEMRPGTVGSMQPISVLYPIKYWCYKNNRMIDEGSGDNSDSMMKINDFYNHNS